jgi:hypothetical protein
MKNENIINKYNLGYIEEPHKMDNKKKLDIKTQIGSIKSDIQEQISHQKNILDGLNKSLESLSLIEEKLAKIPEEKKSIGSRTATGGLDEELFIIALINDNSLFRQKFLEYFDTKPSEKKAVKVKGSKKTDIGWVLNIQHKKTKVGQFGQIARHTVDYLLLQIPEFKKIERLLRGLCEIPLIDGVCDKKKGRIPLSVSENHNITEEMLNTLILLFKTHIKEILKIGFNGLDPLNIPDVLSCSYFKDGDRKKIIAWNVPYVMEYISTQPVSIKPSRTVIKIGECLTFQRKGGDRGKKSGNNFALKIVLSNIPVDKAFIYKF